MATEDGPYQKICAFSMPIPRYFVGSIINNFVRIYTTTCKYMLLVTLLHSNNTLGLGNYQCIN